ncbi:5-formyltetrahydrofolate cyclo-ligase [Tianweitania sediminis]|uniref:5-formyltetrahydrofolate cyclo-ligase n=1 Tax=Tianweitania sediminis TaxID=1502156 RepID=A0A8J7QZZ2_9HYPH|nr:5-formyltetrahydrofolate cyclo-ligase [Tianweitania sediminis]MBP0437998.1 5-formyltetrahydrofolate cyclo-ligase [Tianweitania sediminis]
MSNVEEDLGRRTYSSPPCYLGEFSYEPLRVGDPDTVAAWRKAVRERLLAERLALPVEERSIRSARIVRRLEQEIGDPEGKTVGSYWPVRGEPDLRSWAIGIVERGGRLALPVVIAKGSPLEYRLWMPGDPLERGVWNILVPAHGAAVLPDIVVAPLVGYDPHKFRLGYGGGFFDRTLAAMPSKPCVIGIGYGETRIPTIYPQPHDIPMDLLITE